MNTTIWKYPVSLGSCLTVIEMPKGARILSIQEQHQAPTIWAEVDPEAPLEPRKILHTTAATPQWQGWQDATFLGTVLLAGGHYVAHFYEVTTFNPVAAEGQE